MVISWLPLRIFTTEIARCLDRDMHFVVTTEKDAVRFPALDRLDLPVYFLRIEIDILNGHDHFDAFLSRICNPPPLRPGRDP